MNLSWYEYNVLWNKNNREHRKNQLQLLFKDKQTGVDSLVSQLKIDGFLSSDCDGYIRLFSPNSPIYNITSYGNREKIIKDFEKNVIDSFSQKHNLYFLARDENLAQKIAGLNSRNYSIDTVVNIYPTFTTKKMSLYLLKIKICTTDSLKNTRPDTFMK